MPLHSRCAPIGANDWEVALGKGRHVDLPKIYETPSHPRKKSAGKIYYFLQDTSLVGMRKAAKLEKTLKYPVGTEGDAIHAGFLHLHPGDIVFCRALDARSSGEDDATVCWVTGPEHFSTKQKAEMTGTRNDALGPRESRTRECVNFEANKRANPVKPGIRCYSVGNSYETQTRIMAPCKDNKVCQDQDQEALRIRTALLKAGASIAMTSMEAGPPHILEHIKLNADIINVPAMGTADNVAYTAAQLNVAPAQPYMSGENLSKALGSFGEEHQDTKDNLAYFTHMVAISDLPERYDPGRFFILYPGLFITLSDFACINFSGLRMHGGCPPRAPEHADPSELNWATRFCLILYPPNGQTSGQQRYALGALPDHSTFYISPEMTQATPLKPSDVGWCYHANYVEDGSIVQSRRGQTNFLTRSFACSNLYFAQQMGEEIRLDLSQFLRSFLYKDPETGQWRRADDWEHGPGHRVNNGFSNSEFNTDVVDDNAFVEQASVRAAANEKWLAYYNHSAKHIPYAAIKSKGNIAASPEELDKAGDNLDLGLAIGGDDVDSDGEAEVENLNDDTQTAVDGTRGRPFLNASEAMKRKRKAKDVEDEEPVKRQRVREAKAGAATISRRVLPKTSLLAVEITKRQGAPPSTTTQTNLGLQGHSSKPDTNRSAVSVPIALSAGGRQTRAGKQLQVQKKLQCYVDIPVAQRLPSFISQLSISVIRSEHNSVRMSATHALSKFKLSKKSRQAFTNLDSLGHIITASPSSPAILRNIQLGWSALRLLEDDCHETNLHLRTQRRATMMYTYSIWYWLEVEVTKQASAILEGTSMDVDSGSEGQDWAWLATLISKVKAMAEDRSIKREFSATASGLQLDTRYTVKIKGISVWAQPAGMVSKLILSIVVDIIQHWLQFPRNPNACAQAWFVHVIVTQLGIDFLLLDYIWSIYANVSKNKFLRGTWRLESFSQVQPIRDMDPGHPLFDKASEEHKLVTQIGSLMCQADTDLSTATSEHDAVTSDAHANQVLPASQALPLVPASSPSLSAPAPSSSPSLQAFASFISDAAQFANGITGRKPTYSKYIDKLSTIPDKFMAFREVAPGRMRFKGADGPFAADTIRTTRGIFSAMVWRGVTFTTSFSQEGPMVFDSADDFHQIRANNFPGNGDMFFCDPAAYGVTNPKRRIALVDKYWEALDKDLWPKYLREEPKTRGTIGFRGCFLFFRQRIAKGSGELAEDKRKKGKNVNKDKPLFPEFGPLASYLLTADLVYAGVVTAPTADDIAWIICELNKGAAAGLQELGLIPSRRASGSHYNKKPDVDQCKAGITRVYETILSSIPSEHHKSLFIDYIAVEHSLCKFSRTSNHGCLA